MKRKGLTLIELLSGLAILIILAACLWPVFARAKYIREQKEGLHPPEKTSVRVGSSETGNPSTDRFIVSRQYAEGKNFYHVKDTQTGVEYIGMTDVTLTPVVGGGRR